MLFRKPSVAYTVYVSSANPVRWILKTGANVHTSGTRSNQRAFDLKSFDLILYKVQYLALGAS